MTKLIPAGTKIYKTLANCCKFQYRNPAGVQAVVCATTKKAIGFAALPEKIDGRPVAWVR